MNEDEFQDLIVLAERLHLQFLETIRLDLESLNRRDINDVRALMLLSIGDAEMTVGELVHRGCYFGANVSYNLGKLTEAGYIIQTRSPHDRRVIMVRNSERGLALRAILRDMNARRLATFNETTHRDEDLQACRRMLRLVQHFWGRAADAPPAPSHRRGRPITEGGASQPVPPAAGDKALG